MAVNGWEVLVGVHPRLGKNYGDAEVGGQPLLTKVCVTGSKQEFFCHPKLSKTPSRENVTFVKHATSADQDRHSGWAYRGLDKLQQTGRGAVMGTQQPGLSVGMLSSRQSSLARSALQLAATSGDRVRNWPPTA